MLGAQFCAGLHNSCVLSSKQWALLGVFHRAAVQYVCWWLFVCYIIWFNEPFGDSLKATCSSYELCLGGEAHSKATCVS